MSPYAHNVNKEYDKPEFREMWDSELTIVEIAEKFGVSGVAVSRAAARRGFPSRAHRMGVGLREYWGV